MPLRMTDRPSPNFGPRASGAEIDILLLHYTGMESAEGALDRLTDPAARVSAHYLIDEGGGIFRLVEEEMRAWHAGESAWAGERDVNSRAIGIELTNPGHEFGYRDFPEPQIEALIALARRILARHAIPAYRVLGHSDVAPGRKMDPGERFPWPRLAGAGIGLYPPSDLAPAARAPDEGAFIRDLARFGYGIDREGSGVPPLPKPEAVITAFRRHFRPERLEGPLDAADGARLAWLLDASRSGA